MDADVTITLDITLKSAAAKALIAGGSAGLETSRTFPGCREVRIVQHRDEPNRFLFVQRWATEKHYGDYIVWRIERGEFQKLASMTERSETTIWPSLVGTT